MSVRGMPRGADSSVEWRSLAETAVVPLTGRVSLRRSRIRRRVAAVYPFPLVPQDLHVFPGIGVVIVVPTSLTEDAARRPIPVLALRGRRYRRATGGDAGVYAFGTPRGFDYYRVEAGRITACWSATSGDDSPPDSVLPAPPPARTPRRLRRHGPRPDRRVVAPALLLIVAVIVTLAPRTQPPPEVRQSGLEQRTVAPTDPLPAPPGDPFTAVLALAASCPEATIAAVDGDRRTVRWQIVVTGAAGARAVAILEQHPALVSTVRTHDGRTTFTLEVPV